MFTVKTIRVTPEVRHAYEAERYEIFKSDGAYEVVIQEPGKPEKTALNVHNLSSDGWDHLIIENAQGRNVEHLRAVDFKSRAQQKNE